MHRPHRLARPGRLLVTALIATTSLGAPAVATAADAPGSCGSATSSPKNAWLANAIGSSTDVDWFRFTFATGTRAILTLGDLPADYDVHLYAGCSTLVAASTRSGRQVDEIYRHLPAGTYHARITGYRGAHAASPYVLRLRTLPWGLPVLSSTDWTDADGYVHVVGEVLNNTAEARRWIQLDASFLNGSGATIGGAVGYTTIPTLAPWSRSPFEIVARRPAGHASTSVRVCTPSAGAGCTVGQVAPAPPGGLTVAPGPSHLDASGRRHYTGTIRNGGASTAHLVRAAITLYNARGAVRGLAVGFAEPSKLAPGEAAPYQVVGQGTASPNLSDSVAIAARTGCRSAPRYTGAQENLVPPLTRATGAGRVALTFDMGGRMTPAVDILNLLVENRVCATIFPTGAISRTPEGQAALAVVKAHPHLFELGNHTMNHCDLVRGGGGAPAGAEATFCRSFAPSPTEAEVRKELVDGDAWIRLHAGMPTTPLWRAPYGVANATVRTWAAQAGWTKHVDWDIDTIDWKPITDGGPTARSMTLKVVNGATSGSIVLMHLGGYETLDALQSMIDGLRSRGFTLTTVSDLSR